MATFVYRHGPKARLTKAEQRDPKRYAPLVTGSDILQRLNTIVRAAIADKRKIERMDVSQFTEEAGAIHKAAQQRKAAQATASALNELYEDVKGTKATAEKNRHKARFPLRQVNNDSSRVMSAQEYQAGTNLVMLARDYPTRLLWEALRSGRIDFASGIMDAAEMKRFDSPPSIESAAQWQAAVDQVRSQTGLQSHDSEITVLGKAESLIQQIVHVEGESISLDLGPTTLTAMGLAGLPGQALDEDRSKPQNPAPGTPAHDQDELDQIDDDLEQARADRAAEIAAQQ